MVEEMTITTDQNGKAVRLNLNSTSYPPEFVAEALGAYPQLKALREDLCAVLRLDASARPDAILEALANEIDSAESMAGALDLARAEIAQLRAAAAVIPPPLIELVRALRAHLQARQAADMLHNALFGFPAALKQQIEQTLTGYRLETQATLYRALAAADLLIPEEETTA